MSLRTGGREAVEDTPVTGATEETATDHIALAIQSEIDYDPIWCRGMAREITGRLESEGYVIVRSEDALTTEDRAAIGRVYAEIVRDDCVGAIGYAAYKERETFRAIAAGGQK